MAVFTLDSLVLRGVAILRDELAVNLRKGTSEAKETTEVFISMRHSLASEQVYQPAGWPEASDPHPTAAAVLGAGRSPSCAGVLGCSARSPEQAIPSGWLSSRGLQALRGNKPARRTPPASIRGK